MKAVVSKGAYHNHCRSSLNPKNTLQNLQLRTFKNQKIQRDTVTIQHFNDFQAYLLHIQGRNSQLQGQIHPFGSSLARQAKNLRPKTHQISRKSLDKCKQIEEPVKPFFPFFKCKIEVSPIANREGFRINNRKFKLNHRIIEENTGKAEQKYIYE